MELKKYKLADIGKVITGKTPSTSIAENYAWGTIPFYTPEDVAKGLGMMGRNSRFISETGFEEIASNTISGESVLVGCIGSDMGNVAYSNITCATNQQINAITQFKNGIEPLYVYYLLSTMKSYFQKIAGSTTTPILPKSVFEEIEIHLPGMKKQKDVVSILYALDRKIELNKQINDNLEAMAKQLYDYWFVQFDFPNEEGKPYKSSGGAMVYNEKMKREIPQGWHCYELNKWLEIKSGFAFKSETYISKGKFKVVTIKNVQDHHLDTSSCDYVYEIPQGMKEWCSLSVNDRLISLTGNCGRLCIVTEKDLLLNQRVGLLACNDEYIDYAYLLLSSEEYQTLSNNLAKGAAQANLSPVDLCKNIAVLPKLDVLEKFNRQIKPIVASYIQNEIQIAELTKQRDELLPLLMNGQASVNYHLSDD